MLSKYVSGENSDGTSQPLPTTDICHASKLLLQYTTVDDASTLFLAAI